MQLIRVCRLFTLCLILYWIRHNTTNGSTEDTAIIHQLFAILELMFLQSTPNNLYPSPQLLHCDTAGCASLGFHADAVGPTPPHGPLPNSLFTFAVSAWMCSWKHELLATSTHKHTTKDFPTLVFISPSPTTPTHLDRNRQFNAFRRSSAGRVTKQSL